MNQASLSTLRLTSVKKIGGVLVTGLARRVDRLAQIGAHRHEPLLQRRDMRGDVALLDRIGLERRPVAHHLEGAAGEAAEDHRPLGHQIRAVAEPPGDVVEQLVDADESSALEVPVRLLHRQRQRHGVGEVGVEELDHRGAGILVEVRDEVFRHVQRSPDLQADDSRTAPGAPRFQPSGCAGHSAGRRDVPPPSAALRFVVSGSFARLEGSISRQR